MCNFPTRCDPKGQLALLEQVKLELHNLLSFQTRRWHFIIKEFQLLLRLKCSFPRQDRERSTGSFERASPFAGTHRVDSWQLLRQLHDDGDDQRQPQRRRRDQLEHRDLGLGTLSLRGFRIDQGLAGSYVSLTWVEFKTSVCLLVNIVGSLEITVVVGFPLGTLVSPEITYYRYGWYYK